MLDYDSGPSPLRTPVHRALPCSGLWTVTLRGTAGTDPCVLCCPSVRLLEKPRSTRRSSKESWGCSGSSPAEGGAASSWFWYLSYPLALSPGQEWPPLYLNSCHVQRLPVHPHAAPKSVSHALATSSSPSLRGRVWASGHPGVWAHPVRQGTMLTSSTRCTEQKTPTR